MNQADRIEQIHIQASDRTTLQEFMLPAFGACMPIAAKPC